VRNIPFPTLALLIVSLTPPQWGADHSGAIKPNAPATGKEPVLWSEPKDWATRDLYYGAGGKAHEPHGPFTFVKEDLGGTNPKFVIHDRDGIEWKVKLGLEARSETAAARIVWAAGFYTDEEYLLRDMQIGGMPRHLHRGQKLIGPGGKVHNARLKRERQDAKKTGPWRWKRNELVGSRELNGLRTLMAVINNWDLKDVNTAIYTAGSKRTYVVSDLGASFGSAGRSWPAESAKDNLDSYSKSKFIRRVTPTTVDFQTPARPAFEYLVDPKAYITRVRMESLGRNIPRADARWVGLLLAHLSSSQIRNAFRAAGYSLDEIEGFAMVVEHRIALLTEL
jgi:hypothetical protein